MQIGQLTIHGKSHSVTPLEWRPVVLYSYVLGKYRLILVLYWVTKLMIMWIIFCFRATLNQGALYGRRLYHTEFHTDGDKRPVSWVC